MRVIGAKFIGGNHGRPWLGEETITKGTVILEPKWLVRELLTRKDYEPIQLEEENIPDLQEEIKK